MRKKLCREDFINVCTIVSHYTALSFKHVRRLFHDQSEHAQQKVVVYLLKLF